MEDSSTCSALPAAATRVITSPHLFHIIQDFIDGVHGSVVSLVTDFERSHQDVPWSSTGALTQAAIQRGDLKTLRGLRQLSATRRFQSRPELAFDGATTRCAIQFGRLEILQYLATTGMLLGDSSSKDTTTSINSPWAVGSTLLGWAARYSEALPSESKLEIVQWVVGIFPRSTLRTVKTEDLSRAGLSVLRFLKERRLAVGGFEDPRLVDLVATMGKMEVLKFLVDGEERAVKCTTAAMDGAAANGHLGIVQYLHSDRREGCTTAAMDGAARNGHMEVVRFLHTHRTEGCTTAAMDGAARNGHLEMVGFLHSYREEGCTAAAMDGAAAGGFFEVVRFLHEDRTEGCTTKAMDGAARSGHLDVVQYLHTHRDEGCTTDAIDGAALVGRLPVIKYLHEQRKEGCTTRALDGAAWRGNLEVVQFLVTHRLESCTSKAMDAACQNGYLEIVRFLHEHGSVTCTTAAMDNAASGGHLAIVQYLQEKRVDGCTKDAMTNAAINGHADVVVFLGENRHEGPHDYALVRTAAQGHVTCVDALCRYSIRGCLFEARRAALEAGYPRVVVLLSSWTNPDVHACSSLRYHALPGPRWCQRKQQQQQQQQQQYTQHIPEAATSKEVEGDANKKSTSSQRPFGWWLYGWI